MSCSNVSAITSRAVIVILQSLSQNNDVIYKTSEGEEATTGDPGVSILRDGDNNEQSWSKNIFPVVPHLFEERMQRIGGDGVGCGTEN